MIKTLKVLSALLTYPTRELASAACELKAALAAEALLGPTCLSGLGELIDEIAGGDIYETQERYVFLFDRTRSLSLHLFEHVHGESRERGQAMVDLLKVYEDAGFSPTASELPDYLPLFLEYAATRDPVEALELVGQPGHVFAALGERLAKRGSRYQAVFAALVALANAQLDEEALAALRAEPDPEPDDLQALDAMWEEEEVRFGPGAAAADCGKDSLVAKVRQARRPAHGVERPPGGQPRPVFSTPAPQRL